MNWRTLGVILLLLAVVFTTTQAPVRASSHREAPLISGDPKADATDLFAFVSPDNPETVTLIANYLPFQEPAGGPNFYSFDPNVLYEIKVDNDGDAHEDISYQFRFQDLLRNPNTFLYATGPIDAPDDPDWNTPQTYTLTRGDTELGRGLVTPPSHVGPQTTPNYPALQEAAIHTVADDIKVFAGQRDDPFFVDLGGAFDLLTIRNPPGDEGGGVDGLAGYGVLTLALQVPIEQLLADDQHPTIGVWTTSSRPSQRVLRTDGSQEHDGPWVQVSRLGSPLVNEVVIPLEGKDRWNASAPRDDGQFANFVANPELGTLLNALYGIAVPPQGDVGSGDERDDLMAVFLTGIPGLTDQGNQRAAEMLRLNTAIPPTETPNRFGVLGGDTQGYPNGRRLADDVTDISLRAVAGAVYALFHPGFIPDPLANRLGDGVDENDKAFLSTFPYLALPGSGFDSVPHCPAP
ncbi:MAG: hypothetical protein G01um101438_600 [Parcubacteria group bacterium Gr01-1014_38]|nr:MAG: hypothetical protein G01um101438_600 [Parcubacteria group bacterium Gr01-1014_38]